MNDGMSPADVAAVVDNNRGYAYGYPVMPMYGGYGYGNNSGFGDGSWLWLIIILALFNGGWGNGFGGGFGGFGNTFNNDFAWLSNGQKEIMQNTNNGFDTLQLSNQIEGVRDGVFSLSNQLCNSTADVTQAITSGFASAEIADNARQMTNMQQAFNNQITTLQGFNGVQSQLAECCCDNRLATQDLKATVISENCADREALSNGIRDIITSNTANTQRILDKLCENEIANLRDKLADRDRELQSARFQASQVAQTADIRANNAVVANQLVAELRSCPIPAQPVYGNQPIFTCNGNNGCGCGNTFGSTIV